MRTRRQAKVGATELENADNRKRLADAGIQPQPGRKRTAFGDITNAIQNVKLNSEKRGSSLIPKISSDKTAGLGKNRPTKHSVTLTTKGSSQTSSATAPADLQAVSSLVERERAIPEESHEKDPFPAAEEAKNEPHYPYDIDLWDDPFSIAHYARDIFRYYQKREKKFLPVNLLENQPEVTPTMRAVLVDWMVEIQENFELNHETLYQAVKMMDLFLYRVPNCQKDDLQKYAAASLLISCKFDERIPPAIDDFLYVCDDAYSREELMKAERVIIKMMDFDVGAPCSYRFLRRYAKATGASFELLTLGRFILEKSLLFHNMMSISDSKIAAAALLLAQRMMKKAEDWTEEHALYSGYKLSDIEGLMWDLNNHVLLGVLPSKVKTITTKYSHHIFKEVAKIKPLESSKVNKKTPPKTKKVTPPKLKQQAQKSSPRVTRSATKKRLA